MVMSEKFVPIFFALLRSAGSSASANWRSVGIAPFDHFAGFGDLLIQFLEVAILGGQLRQ